mgnify:CR=1 FL=1
MAEYLADAAQARRPSMTVTGVGQATVNRGKFTVATALSAADTVGLCKLPAGHVPVDFILDSEDLDTNGSPTITLKAGILGGGDDGAFFAADAVGQGGGIKRLDLAGGVNIIAADVDRVVGITVVAGAATGATGVEIGGTLISRPTGLDD